MAGYRPADLSAEQQAVVDAYQRYWDFRARSFGDAKVDPSEAGKVAEAGAIVDMQRYVAQQQQKGTRTVGQSTTNVLSVTVSGTAATLKDCFDDQSADVSTATGKPVETPAGKIEFTTKLEQSGGSWLVTRSSKTAPTCTVPSG